MHPNGSQDREKREGMWLFSSHFLSPGPPYIILFNFFFLMKGRGFSDSIPLSDGVARFHPHCLLSFSMWRIYINNDTVQYSPALLVCTPFILAVTWFIQLLWEESMLNANYKIIGNIYNAIDGIKKKLWRELRIGNKICEKSDQPLMQMTSQKALPPWKRQALLSTLSTLQEPILILY